MRQFFADGNYEADTAPVKGGDIPDVPTHDAIGYVTRETTATRLIGCIKWYCVGNDHVGRLMPTDVAVIERIG